MDKNPERDLKFMKEAIVWAGRCQPIKKSIPKVGAIIAIGDDVLGRGRRDTGEVGDDDHAELNALRKVPDKSMLTRATLYTTLEPCTIYVRSNPLDCCTEQILQHKINRVFVGILDPNQGVTGKGLLRLQDSGVDVVLFPHELSQEIRVQNRDFILSQQTLTATIVAPKDREELPTGTHPVRFKCLNPPGADTYLLAKKAGLYWPQSSDFREIERGLWETDVNLGSTGEHSLELVTADSLGAALIRYYRKTTEQNRNRREKLRGKIDLSLLGVDHPGIDMIGLPKGLRLEASVKVIAVDKVRLISASVEPETVVRGRTLKISYDIECSQNVPSGIWLGASFKDSEGNFFFDKNEDKAISLTKGKNKYERNLTIAPNAPLGDQMLQVAVWRGKVTDPSKSKWIGGHSMRITIVK